MLVWRAMSLLCRHAQADLPARVDTIPSPSAFLFGDDAKICPDTADFAIVAHFNSVRSRCAMCAMGQVSLSPVDLLVVQQADFDAYQSHPQHQAVLMQMRDIVAQRVSLQFNGHRASTVTTSSAIAPAAGQAVDAKSYVKAQRNSSAACLDMAVA